MPPRLGNPAVATKRIKKEIADLSKENLGSITLTPNESNILQWRATIPGPVGSPYEGGMFEVDIRVPTDYPFSPPHLHFLTKVYHCNIAQTGAICLDILKNSWSPALSLYKVVLSLSSLLTDPNPADPLVPQIAQEYRSNRKKHDATARDWVKKFATPANPPSLPPAPKLKSPVVAPPPVIPPTARRAISRPLPASASSTPPPQLAGTRRSAGVINIDDDSDDEVRVLEESGRMNGVGVGAGAGGSNGQGAGGQGDGQGRAAKRAKTGGSAGDAIVID
ncbi:hypothetical protein IAT38_002815 [Cryptococcus sp. DSM 104549]